ncbi:MAG TPA: branched-chain amino acid ABC transporter permease [Hypericibacter adhaerens]|jgi:branched-chain amino acid transport system permease protein|uniref:branched-chain amino acid ABC transporter permease n=1 Tax=Hypericibacter adhaerens TaxID=2602016 RepID=UPI002BAF0745|nr:branched-chain amino acid ABC transporter permease [Hypericibacter adhaerens]HWA44154.1 branched-chain amino acid ABC transporter permease [Hypericibacter adhaerens]
MNSTILVQTILSGLAAGGLYALVAISFGIVYRTTRVFNFAQGDFGALGAYVAFSVLTALPGHYWLALVIGCLAVGIFAAAVEFVAIRPLYRLGELYTFITTIGLSFAIQSGIQQIWGPFVRVMPNPFGDRAVKVLGLRVVPDKIWIFSIAILLTGVLFVFLAKTKYGTAMRACAQDSRVANLLGIKVGRMFSGAFFLSGMVGAFAGILIAPITYLQPTMGLQLGVPGYIAALLGGLGSMPGALIGGFILGIVQAVSVLVIDPRYSPIVTYVVFVIVLLVRARGLFGEETVQGRLV